MPTGHFEADEAVKHFLSSFIFWCGYSPAHSLRGSVRLSHSHLTLKAIPWRARFFTPRPPNLLGLQIFSHATRQRPPFAFFLPAQKKPHIHLQISSRAQRGASAMIIVWMGLAAMAEFIGVSLPSLAISPRCQCGIHSVNRSIAGCHSAFVRGLKASCRPRYFIGKHYMGALQSIRHQPGIHLCPSDQRSRRLAVVDIQARRSPKNAQ